MEPGTRDRMIDATVDALRTKGVTGMSFTEILAASGAARGAIYHHFPGGKAELVAAAAQRNGEQVCGHLAELAGTDPLAVVEAFLTAVRPAVQGAADGGGCAVAAVTVDPDNSGNDPLRSLASSVFDSWTTTLTRRLVDAGAGPEAAADLATTLIALLQGAHVLSRADRSLDPFDRVARSATELVAHRYPRTASA